jgi:hypothetical protein
MIYSMTAIVTSRRSTMVVRCLPKAKVVGSSPIGGSWKLVRLTFLRRLLVEQDRVLDSSVGRLINNYIITPTSTSSRPQTRPLHVHHSVSYTPTTSFTFKTELNSPSKPHCNISIMAEAPSPLIRLNLPSPEEYMKRKVALITGTWSSSSNNDHLRWRDQRIE